MFLQNEQHYCFLDDLEAEWFAFRFINTPAAGRHRTAQQVIDRWKFVGEPTEIK